MINTIGAELIESIEDAHRATHVIPSNGVVEMRRTAKLMVCLCTTAIILHMDWLEHSSEQQCILDTEDYLLIGKKRDIEAESRYKFSLEETIQNGLLARENLGGVLGGWSVYICNGVAGNKFPDLEQLRLIIKAAGGYVQESLPNSSLDKTLLLTSDWAGVPNGMEGARILTQADFLRVIMTQNPYNIGMYIFTLSLSYNNSLTLISSTNRFSYLLRFYIRGRTGRRIYNYEY